MTFLIGLKDFFSGLTRGLSLFFTERNDHLISATTPGLIGQKRH